MKILRQCIQCSKDFFAYQLEIDRGRKKYCCRTCFTEAKKTLFAGKANPFYGKNHSEEVRKYLGDLKRGIPSWNKGGKAPWMMGNKNVAKRLEVREKLRGRIISEETRKKISIINKGRKCSNAKKIKIAESLAGRKRPDLAGERCHFWQGGRSTESMKIKSSLEYKDFIKKCLHRDSFTCKKCKKYKSSVKLNVHHILNFASYPNLRTFPANGITLCLEHHKEFHSLYGKKMNCYHQIRDFVNN